MRYVEHLATTGVQWGLIGPREIPRLWERHVLNCALLTDLVPHGVTVADVGSGAGLPGVVLALRRPDLQLVLIEPLLRRVRWLEQVVADLGLDGVQVRRARAEALVGELVVPVVTARAVAPLDRLARWALPLLAPGGELLAIKGRTAHSEREQHWDAVRRAGGVSSEIVTVGSPGGSEVMTVVRVKVGPVPSTCAPSDCAPSSPAPPTRSAFRRSNPAAATPPAPRRRVVGTGAPEAP